MTALELLEVHKIIIEAQNAGWNAATNDWQDWEDNSSKQLLDEFIKNVNAINAEKDECYAEVKDIHREFEVVRYGKKGKSYIDNLLKRHDVNEQIFSAFKKDKSMMDAIKQSILKAIEEDRVRRMSK